ncbi:conjugal transfer protein [Dietzia cercidiphylli]|uniref:conjugal transfer protein n=1 Tax=Dietzia cercidiphylli TaxID=498199 RepID=UPI00223BCCA5|nr:conjugal transfer protein [Dietzia cercidiphylli]MCT1515316.1 conjugal transfer protein [Dietzia cercidiphylli]
MKLPGRKNKGDEQDAVEPAEQEQWTQRQSKQSASAKYLLIAAIACGPLAVAGGVMGAFAGPQTALNAAPVAVENEADEAVAAQLARSLVVTWLEAKRGDESALSNYVATDGLSLPVEPLLKAAEPAVAGVERVPASAFIPGADEQDEQTTSPTSSTTAEVAGPAKERAAEYRDGYAITVAVWVRPAESDAPAVQRYFRVPVVFTPTGPRAVSLPAPVAGLPVGSQVQTGYDKRVDTNHPMGVSALQFLNAMLAGSGDISRYTAPGTVIRPVDPPMAQSVKVTDMRSMTDVPPAAQTVVDGTQIRVLATTRLVQEGGAERFTTSQFALTMSARAGRWEVVALDAMPSLSATGGAAGLAGMAGASPSPETAASSGGDGQSSPAQTPAPAGS